MGLMKEIAIDILNGEHKHTYRNREGLIRIGKKGKVQCQSCKQWVSKEQFREEFSPKKDIFLRKGI